VVTQAARATLGEEHPHCAWAIAKVVAVLQAETTSGAAAEASNTTLSSMLLDYIPSNFTLSPSSPRCCFEEVSASRCMSFVHGTLVEHCQSRQDEARKAAWFGRAGLGPCHAFDCHQFLLRMTTRQTHFCWSATRESWIPLVLGPTADIDNNNIAHDRRRRIVHVRTRDDLAKLTPSDYGLPSICNYPLIDSVLTPGLATHMAISKRHRGAVHHLRQSTESLQFGQPTMKMVFFVTENNLKDFVFPTDLPGVELYVTVPVASDFTMEKATNMR
jgi:hypothetical protein